MYGIEMPSVETLGMISRPYGTNRFLGNRFPTVKTVGYELGRPYGTVPLKRLRRIGLQAPVMRW